MPQIFGIEHIIYFITVVLLMIISIILIKKYVKNDLQLTRVIKFIGLILLTMIILNRISIAYYHENLYLLFPDSFCGTSSLVLALGTIFCKRNNNILHFVSYIGIFGGGLTLIYPDFIGQADSIFHPLTITGLLHHTVMVFLVIVMLITNYLQPSLKKWYCVPIGLSFFMSYGLFLITVIGHDDAMYIFKPALPDTIFNWFGLGLIFIPVQFIFLVIWEKLKNVRGEAFDTEKSHNVYV